jgi:hypothetical protein
MRELDVLKDKRDVNLAATMTLMLGHKYSQTVGTYNTRTTFTVFKTEKIWIDIQINYKIYPAMTAFTDQYSLPNIFFDIGQL